MKQNTHTPGPWTVTRGTNGHTETWQVAHESALRSKTIADCGPVQYTSANDATDTFPTPRASAENAANARLIAAAPALLAALDDIVSRLGRNSTAMANYGDLVAAGRKAIASARGEG